MSPIISTSAARQSGASGLFGRMARAARHGWQLYRAWYVQEATIAYLKTLSDRQLKDIGLTRSQIGCAVRGAFDRHSTHPRDC
jgi:uncharacterized protein YjiS (DUF1127 family)